VQGKLATLIAGAMTLLVIGLGAAYAMTAAGYWREAAIVGEDYRIVISAAARWLSGDGFYLPYQLAGPYDHGAYVGSESPVLYPPTMLLLFAPFTVLPAVLWWVIPLIVTSLVIVGHRPRAIVWPVLAILTVFPMTQWEVVTGNPVMWFTMALGLGTKYLWPSVAVLLKPTIALFALFGSWSRSWWMALGVLGLLSLSFLPMWPEYIEVLRNTQTPMGPLFSLNQYPMLLIPVVAWLGRWQPATTNGMGDGAGEP
jgi:hypothetical protein